LSARHAKRILIAPLDWGLGHTTRCVPIIRYLLSLDHEVVFAGEQWQQDYISRLFPSLPLRNLAGYRVRYSASGFMTAVMRQIPRIVRLIKHEHDWLHTLLQNEHIDGIISDNRYGLWSSQTPSVVLTHQLHIISGIGPWADNILQRIHARYLGKFGQCWVVDTAGKPNLGGILSHPPGVGQHARYIGWLSQLAPLKEAGGEKHLLILLSGPEPQRTILSDLLWRQVSELTIPVVFVEGSPSVNRAQIPPHISYHRQVDASTLQPLLESATMVVCRSGYSSLMDLVLVGKKAILIPTPGQTEQEYLADMLMKQGVFYSRKQAGFSLQEALEAANKFPYTRLNVPGGHEMYRPVVDRWLESL
jgi:hypothetical protein